MNERKMKIFKVVKEKKQKKNPFRLKRGRYLTWLINISRQYSLYNVTTCTTIHNQSEETKEL